MKAVSFFLMMATAAIYAAERGDSATLDGLSGTNTLPLITTARELHNLPLAEARRHYPLRIRGVVTFFDANLRNLFVHDGTNGFWVYRDYHETNFQTGQLIEIEGVSDGVTAPAPRPSSIRILGTAPLPEPRWATFEQLASGKVDCEWLQVQGVVRTMAWRLGLLKIDLAVGGNHVPLYLPGFAHQPLPTHLVGSVIHARGICSMKMSQEFQIIGFWFYVPSLDFITVTRSAPEDPFAMPTRPVRSFREWNAAEPETRVKVKGIVTWASSGRFYLRDETAPLQVRLQQPWLRDDPKGRYLDPPPVEPLQPSDLVEVIGYPSPGEFGHVLTDAVYRRVSRAESPEPRTINAVDALQPKADGELVRFEARLLELESRRSGNAFEQVLLLQTGNTFFEALLAGSARGTLPLTQGSVLRVSGVNSVHADRWLKGRSFQLLLRSPADVVVLKTGPRWTARQVARFGVVAILVGVVGLAWIAALRRQVRAQTARVSERSSELQAANRRLEGEVAARQHAEEELRVALDAEKQLGQLRNSFVSMVSHQFRTPLGAILSSAEILHHYQDKLTMEKRQKHLRTIHESVERMSGLVEEVLVFNRSESGQMEFRPGPLDLPALCRRLVEEVCAATSRRCPILFEANGTPGAAHGDEGLLRHILTNLLDNAVKYSPSGSDVTLTLRRENHDALFVVRDRGAGIPIPDQPMLFTPFHRGSNTRGLQGTGLGMVIVKRCVERHGGKIEVQSGEDVGTTVTVRLPLFTFPAVPNVDAVHHPKDPP